MGDFAVWLSKLLINLDEGNLREALHCSDMALYSVESMKDDPGNEDLAKVYFARGKVLQKMGKKDDARSCFRIMEEISTR